MIIQNLIKAIGTSLLSSIYSLCSRVVVLLSQLISIILRIVHRIRTDSVASQHYNEIIKVANWKQSEIHKQTLEVNRLAVEYDRETFRHYLLEGEQQAKCFTLALLVAVFVVIIITLWL
jgi:hypothetical protein